MRSLCLILLLLFIVPVWPQGRITIEVDTGYCLLSGHNAGGIGFDTPDQTNGYGFQYPKGAPSCLYFGSFLVANSPTTVHDHFYGTPATNLHWDWVVRDPFIDVIPPLFGAHELYRASMVDTTRPTPAQGFLVTHWWGGRGRPLTAYDDFVIIRYDVKNNNSNPINGVYLGVFIDFDLGASPTTNCGRIDSLRRMVYMWPSTTIQNPSVGVKLLEPYTFANLIYFDPRMLPPPIMNDSSKYLLLNGTINTPPPRPYDYTICVSAGPIDLASGQWVRTGFAILAAIDSLSLKVYADTAQAWWDRDWRVDIDEELINKIMSTNTIRICPNPCNRSAKIFYNLPSPDKLTIEAYDKSGRAVACILNRDHSKTGSVDWHAGKLPSGVYFLVLKTSKNIYREKVLLLR